MAETSRQPSSRLSPAVEDYLKAIYKLQVEAADEAVSTGAVAQAQDVSAASATNMVKRLAEMGLATYESYKGVRLTDAGAKVALEIIRHHRLLELYLREMMDYPWEKVHEEAEHLEHHISEAFEERLEKMLGYPTHDPHGDPIPTRAGTIAETATRPLTEVAAGQRIVIQRVSDTDPAFLDYLEEVGLLPGCSVQVLGKAPFEGPLTIRTGTQEHVVGHNVARKVFVE